MKNPSGTNWRERKQLELRTHIYEAALELFRTRGFGDTTVQEIASAAGIGKGTFFNYFSSKDHVLQAWYRKLTRTALEKISVSEFASGREAVLALMASLADGASADPGLWDAKVVATSSMLLRQEEDDLDQEVLAFCLSAVEKDISENRFAAGANAEFLTQLILVILTGTAHTWSVAKHRHDLSETLRERVSFVFDAASSDKGIRS
jgi:AcrR family transcriptional regulator